MATDGAAYWSLVGKRVLIIGGVGDGIGGAVARTAAAAGAAGIVVVSRSLDRAGAMAAQLASDRCRTFAIAADVTKDVSGIVDRAAAMLGGIDSLITVVGGIGHYVAWQPLDEMSDADWDLMFEVNVRYVFKLVRDVVRQFLAQGTGGNIVSVGSIAAVRGMPHAAGYGAAKAALLSLATSVAAEYGRRGIRMNVVNSGAVMTESLRKGLPETVSFEMVPVGRPGLPEEIAGITCFLASPAAAYITGQSINVDGGITARGPMRMGQTDSSMCCHCGTPATAAAST